MTEQPARARHTLIIDTSERGWRTFRILCTGPDDSCRAYIECGCNLSPAYDRELFDWLMSELWDGFYHGVEHREIEGY